MARGQNRAPQRFSEPNNSQTTRQNQNGVDSSHSQEPATVETAADTEKLRNSVDQSSARTGRCDKHLCRPTSQGQQLEALSISAYMSDATGSPLPETRMKLVRDKNQFDTFWAASLANGFDELQGKIVVSYLAVSAVRLRLTNHKRNAGEVFPPPPAFVLSSLWSSFLWIEVSAPTFSCRNRQDQLSHLLNLCGPLQELAWIFSLRQLGP